MKRSKWLSFFLVVLAVMLLTGCDTRRDDTTMDDRTVTKDNNTERDRTGTDMETGTDADRDKDIVLFEDNRDYTYTQRDQFKIDVDRAMDRIDNHIDVIEDKIDEQTGAMKDSYNSRLDAVKEKRDNLEKRMDDFDKTMDNNWNQFKSTFRTAWIDLKNDVDKLGKDVGVTGTEMKEQTGTRNQGDSYNNQTR
jgi:peptidoglycan hydrolase CwlO-like protein